MCGRLEEIVGGKREYKDDKKSGSSLRMKSSGSRPYKYSVNNDYNRTRHRNLLNALEVKNNEYKGNKFPKSVLTRTANIYNQIQNLDLIKRSNVKYEIIGILMFRICIIEGTPRRKRDIAEFLNKDDGNKGMSEGEKIVRKLCADGKIDLKLDDDDSKSIQGFADRFLESLGYEQNPNYSKFVVQIVDKANEKYIGANSAISSKVAGAVWILVIHENLRKTKEEVELACDRIRANTFTRFSSLIMENLLKFIDVFESNGIKHGFEGRLTKRRVPAAVVPIVIAPVNDTVKSPVNDTVIAVANDTVIAPVNDTVIAPVNDTVIAPVNYTVKAPVNDTVKAPVNDTVKAPVNDTVIAPVNDVVTDPVNDVVTDPVNDTVKAPVNDTVKSPVNDTVIAPVNDTVKSPVNDTVIAPVNDTVIAPVNDTVKAQVNDVVTDPVNDVVTDLVNDVVTDDVAAPVTDDVVVPSNDDAAVSVIAQAPANIKGGAVKKRVSNKASLMNSYGCRNKRK
jgi:transcription initiation factor TFIIIB Brf1 subunit/transcription initiation factor TFIIB